MWIKLGFKKKIVGAAYIQVRSIDRKLRYVAFSEARRQGFFPGTWVSSPPSLVIGSANKIKLK